MSSINICTLIYKLFLRIPINPYIQDWSSLFLYFRIKLSPKTPLSPHPPLRLILLSFLKLDRCAHLRHHPVTVPYGDPPSWRAGVILGPHAQEKNWMRTTGSELTLLFFPITFQKWSPASIKEIQLLSRILFLNHKNILTTPTLPRRHHSVMINLFTSELKVRGKKITFIYKHIHIGIEHACRKKRFYLYKCICMAINPSTFHVCFP